MLCFSVVLYIYIKLLHKINNQQNTKTFPENSYFINYTFIAYLKWFRLNGLNYIPTEKYYYHETKLLKFCIIQKHKLQQIVCDNVLGPDFNILFCLVGEGGVRVKYLPCSACFMIFFRFNYRVCFDWRLAKWIGKLNLRLILENYGMTCVLFQWHNLNECEMWQNFGVEFDWGSCRLWKNQKFKLFRLSIYFFLNN